MLHGEFREGKIYTGQGVQRLIYGDTYAGHCMGSRVSRVRYTTAQARCGARIGCKLRAIGNVVGSVAQSLRNRGSTSVLLNLHTCRAAWVVHGADAFLLHYIRWCYYFAR